MAEIYYIGGSPCSGKTTLTELLVKRHGLYHFKVDDYLEDYTTRGRSKGKPVCTRITRMSANETWMRSPELQNQEELEFYREIFEYVLFDLNRKNDKRAIITEGAAYLPELMKKNGVDAAHYIAIIPTKSFQVTRYQTRSWVPYLLKDCEDSEKAFQNWMERDALFAKTIKEQCLEAEYQCFVTDGISTPAEMARDAERVFGLLPKENKPTAISQ
ncbi:MAG: hypothetical protein GX683_04930 [Ruminococcaceae bacterium]|nr:hypothetical protein [Oscillospiraceae bacterium]